MNTIKPTSHRVDETQVVPSTDTFPGHRATSENLVEALPAPTKTPYFVWVDILRGLAAIAVVLYHVRVDLWVGLSELRGHPELYSSFDRNLGFIATPFHFFGSGVMLFFLLSGFCVHLPQSRKNNLSFGPYIIRRLLRIYPPYFVAVVFTLVAELICQKMGFSPLSSWKSTIQSFLMLQNYAPFTGKNIASGVQNPSLWSLPVEVELYLAYPLFWFLWRRFNVVTAMGCAATITGIAVLINHAGAAKTAGNFAQYWVIWCAGAWLAERAARQKIPIWKPIYWLVPLVCLVCAVALKLRHLPLPIENLVWATCYFFVLWWGLLNVKAPTVPSRIWVISKWLGTISYSLYLIHYPFFNLSGEIWRSMFGTKPANLLVPLSFVVLSVGLASVFYLLFEAPTHRLARLLGSPKPSTPVS